MKTLAILLLTCLPLIAQNLVPPGAGEPPKSPDALRLYWNAPANTNGSTIVILNHLAGTNWVWQRTLFTNELWALGVAGMTNWIDYPRTNLVGGVTNWFKLAEIRSFKYYTQEPGSTNTVERDGLEETLPTNLLWFVPSPPASTPTNLFLRFEIQSAPTLEGPWIEESTQVANVALNGRSPLFTRVKILTQELQ